MNHYQTIFFILFLLVNIAGVSAATTLIPPGGEVFLGEEGLDLSVALPFPFDAIAFFPPGSSPGYDIPLDIRTVERRGFAVIPSLYLDRTGPWYQWDSRRGAAGSVAVIVREPRVTVRIVQVTTMEDISSGTIPRGTALLMQLDTNIGSVAQRPGYNKNADGILDLLITTPGGGVLSGVETRSGWISLSGVTPEGSLQTVPPHQTGGWNTGARGAGGGYLYASGTYLVQPRLAFNRINENLQSLERTSYIRGASVTLGSDRAKITTSDDQVIRGNAFTVTISGTPSYPVYLWVDAGQKSGSSGDQPPMILFSQEGVYQDTPNGPYTIGSYRPSSYGGTSIRDLVPHEPYGGVKYYARVLPDRDGKRTIEFRTSEQTDDTRYTIRIESQSATGQTISEEASISVVKGYVGIETEKEVFAIGEEVKLSGYNTESCDTYLFITGPNLPSNGARLDRPRQAVRNGVSSSFTVASGDCETWNYRLYTGDLGIDAGTYTIYAVPSPVDRNNLGSVPYQTIPLTLRRPYVSLQTQVTDVARGDSLYLTGRSSGATRSGVAVWIFGKNYFRYDQTSIERDGSFEYKIPGAETNNMVTGQYSVIIQHPMSNGEFDIWPDGPRHLVLGNTPYPGAPIFRIGGSGSLQGPEAANALITALNSPFIDDTYTKYDIRVNSPKITTDVGSLTQVAGTPVVISGTTNLASGSRLLLEITDNRFAPTSKGDSQSSYGYSGTTEIWQGDIDRFFTFTVPTGRLAPGEYRLIIQAVTSDAVTTELLTITAEQIPAIDTTREVNQTGNITSPDDQHGSNVSPSLSPSENISQPEGFVTLPPVSVQPSPISTIPVVEKSEFEFGSSILILLAGVVMGAIIVGIGALIIFRKRGKEEQSDDSAGDDGLDIDHDSNGEVQDDKSH
jgi:hypothetical protein